MNAITLDNPAAHVPVAWPVGNEPLPGALGYVSCGRHSAAWYVIWTKPGQEHVADRELKIAGFPTFFPLYGARRAAYVPMFRRYGFAQANRDAQWVGMLHTRGVAGVIRNPTGAPIAVPAKAMADLFDQCAPNGVIYAREPRTPEEGDRVLIEVGAFAGLTGICARTKEERVWLLMQILGREKEIEFPRKDLQVSI